MANNEGYTYVFQSDSEVFQTTKIAKKVAVPLQLKAVNAITNKTYNYIGPLFKLLVICVNIKHKKTQGPLILRIELVVQSKRLFKHSLYEDEFRYGADSHKYEQFSYLIILLSVPVLW